MDPKVRAAISSFASSYQAQVGRRAACSPLWPVPRLGDLSPVAADGAALGSKLSMVGLDAFPLAPALPPSFASLPPAEFAVEEWEASRRALGCGASRLAVLPSTDGRLPSLKSRAAEPNAGSTSWQAAFACPVEAPVDVVGLQGGW